VVGLGVGLQHLGAWRALPERCEIRALCDRDAERARKVGEALGVPAVFDDYERFLREAELDVVDLCTPPHLHFGQVRAALAAGRHVVCEKPLVASLAEADALARIEAESGRRLMPIFQYRFGAGFQKLRHLVAQGLAGRAFLATVETSWWRGPAYYAVPWRGRFETEIGGVLLSHSIHAHDLLCQVLGPVRRVYARTATRVNPIETEDCAAATLEMADGSLATLAATLGSRTEISRLRFCFEHLVAESPLAPYTPSADPWSFRAGDPEAQARIDAALAGFDAGPEGYPGQFARFCDALERGGELPVTVADARASLELVTALYHSAGTGGPVELPLGPGHAAYRGWGRAPQPPNR
jgi:predicted dehydrogenase